MIRQGGDQLRDNAQMRGHFSMLGVIGDGVLVHVQQIGEFTDGKARMGEGFLECAVIHRRMIAGLAHKTNGLVHIKMGASLIRAPFWTS